MFITFEGGEAVGKTTQIGILVRRLRERSIGVTATREPGGTPLAEKLRVLLLGNAWSPMAEALLHNAARAEHVAGTIRPALDRGDWVVCDRFADSTRAYQGGSVAPAVLAALQGLIGLSPDLTIVLEVSEPERLRRLAARGGQADQYESRPAEFHDGVRRIFRAIAEAEPGRCRLVDADGAPETVADRIWHAVLPGLPHGA